MAMAAVGGLALLIAACSSSSPPSSSTSGPPSSHPSGTLNGSGSTFQLVYQQAALSAFKSVQSGMTVNYAGVGSGTGRANLAAGTVNFAGSDSPIPSTDLPLFKGKTVLYFPVVIGPITMSYNLPGVSKPLQLTPAVISDIFQRNVKAWNAPEIAAINPGVHLPSTPITLAVRSDSSGTTANFSLFLVDSVGSAWKLGSGSTITWPSTAQSASGNSGVATLIKATPGAIGYVDYSTAKASGLSFASVKNKDGNYVAPSVAAASASAAGVTVNPDLTFHAVWGSGATAYPITYQSWDLVYAKQPNANDAAMLKAYLGYLLGDGQKLLTSLNYAPLPSTIDSAAVAQLSKITG
jgi:phosphate transport system substrate-binding protein